MARPTEAEWAEVRKELAARAKPGGHSPADIIAKAWQEYDASFMPSSPPTPWFDLSIEHAWLWISMAEAMLAEKPKE